MSTTSSSHEQLDSLRNALRKLISKTHAYNERKHWVSLDPLWYHHKHREPYTSIVESYLDCLFGSGLQDYVLLCSDTITPAFGLLPVAMLVAHSKRCSFAVWKELGSITWGDSRLYFDSDKPVRCVVLQDVVRHGTTLLKMSEELDAKYWAIVSCVAMVKNSYDPGLLQKTLDQLANQENVASEFFFHSLLDVSDL